MSRERVVAFVDTPIPSMKVRVSSLTSIRYQYSRTKAIRKDMIAPYGLKEVTAEMPARAAAEACRGHQLLGLLVTVYVVTLP